MSGMRSIWREGADLHWSNSLLLQDTTFGVDEFDNLVTSIETELAEYRVRTDLSEARWCLYGTLDGGFDSLSIHGPSGEVATIDLRHTMTN